MAPVSADHDFAVLWGLMTYDQILGKFGTIARIAQARGGWISADLRFPATDADIASCEESIGLRLPQSLASFLMEHDGLLVRVYAPSNDHWFEVFHLEVRSAAAIVSFTREFRAFHERIHQLAPEAVPEDLAERFIDALSLGDPDRYLLIDTKPLPATAEYPVVDVDGIGWGFDQPRQVATSFSEFVDRALAFMADEQGGFRYWKPPDTDW